MIRISSDLGKQVRSQLNSIKDKFELSTNEKYVDSDIYFTEEELSYIVEISIGKNDIKYLNYFKNIEYLEISLYPSIDDNDLIYIFNRFKNIKSISIANQNNLKKIDFTRVNQLTDIIIINNDNLTNVINMNNCKNLKRVSLFNNRSLSEFNSIFDYVFRNDNLSSIEIDISYFVDSINYLRKINKPVSSFNKIDWIEAIGLRNKNYYKYTHNEIYNVFKIVNDSLSKYVFAEDGNIEKFGIAYQWFINNFRFFNTDINMIDDNVGKVFTFGYGSRLTFAKAFQFLLSIVGIDSDIVYSIGALDTIGYNDGKQLYSLSGNTDYALLRVKIDNRNYYCDIAWNSIIKDQSFYDNLRLVLVSLEELKIRHQIVGANVDKKSASYNNRNTEELLLFASDRINKIDNMLFDIEQYKTDMNKIEFNLNNNDKEISSLKSNIDKLDINSDEYKKSFDNLIMLEDKMIDIENELNDLCQKRYNIIKSYKKDILSGYLGLVSVDHSNVNELVSKIDNLLEYGYISNYIYKLIITALKEV